MEIRADQQGDYDVLVLSGEVDAASAPAFQDRVANLLKGGTTRLLIDMAELSYLSSAGLRVFMFTAKRLSRAGGHFGLVAPREIVKNVFVMAALDRLFKFFADRDAAVRALG